MFFQQATQADLQILSSVESHKLENLYQQILDLLPKMRKQKNYSSHLYQLDTHFLPKK